MENELTIKVFKEVGYWVAQLMEHDIAAQGISLWEALDELGRAISVRLTIDDELKINTFEELPPAEKLPLCTCEWVMMSYPNKIKDDPNCPLCHRKE